MTDSYNWSPFENTNNATDLDIELLKMEVGKHFPFYDMKFNKNTAAFFCRIDEELLEESFNLLRKSLKEKGYIPMLKHEQGEHIIYVMKKPKRKEKPVWINYLLLIATIITTILTGSILNMGYLDAWNIPNPADIFLAKNLVNGALFFSLPLMSILFVHEMGHYFISKKHGIATSLPYFIPVPPVLGFNIGTFGALISSRDPMPNKKALFDVGIAGPLAGFFVAIPVIIIGVATAEIIPIPTIENSVVGDVIFGNSLLIDPIISRGLLHIPAGSTYIMSPLIFAGWVGLLITSINLLPAGQLDGGHIFRAVFGEKQKYIGWAAVLIMIFTGWWFFAFIIIFMMGMMHPPPLNDDTDLDLKRKLLFIAAITMLILCYIPNPIDVVTSS